jgi:hypothetical protein
MIWAQKESAPVRRTVVHGGRPPAIISVWPNPKSFTSSGMGKTSTTGRNLSCSASTLPNGQPEPGSSELGMSRDLLIILTASMSSPTPLTRMSGYRDTEYLYRKTQ